MEEILRYIFIQHMLLFTNNVIEILPRHWHEVHSSDSKPAIKYTNEFISSKNQLLIYPMCSICICCERNYLFAL